MPERTCSTSKGAFRGYAALLLTEKAAVRPEHCLSSTRQRGCAESEQRAARSCFSSRRKAVGLAVGWISLLVISMGNGASPIFRIV